MEYRKLGKEGLVSAISFGCNQVGASWYGYKDDNAAIDAIRRAVDIGINNFDTASTYAMGNSEVVLGKALQGIRKNVLISTKAGVLNGGKRNGSAQNLRMSLERSMRRLNTDYIDILYLHHPDPKVPIEESMGAIETFIKEGKVRFSGICNANIEDIKKIKSLTAVQDIFNLLTRKSDIAEFCKSNNIAFFAFSPLAFGLLAGNIFRKPMKRPIFLDTRFWNPAYPALLKLRDFAGQRCLAVLCLAWVLDKVSSAIVGTSSSSQLSQNLQCLSIKAQPLEWQKMESIAAGANKEYMRNVLWAIREKIIRSSIYQARNIRRKL